MRFSPTRRCAPLSARRKCRGLHGSRGPVTVLVATWCKPGVSGTNRGEQQPRLVVLPSRLYSLLSLDDIFTKTAPLPCASSQHPQLRSGTCVVKVRRFSFPFFFLSPLESLVFRQLHSSARELFFGFFCSHLPPLLQVTYSLFAASWQPTGSVSSNLFSFFFF